MKIVLLINLVLLTYMSTLCEARDLLVGQVHQNRLIYQDTIQYNAIPFKKRVKEYFYNEPGQQLIKGIVLRDGLGPDSEAYVIITAGGVGYPYVNLRLKSERGSGLNYHVEFYA